MAHGNIVWQKLEIKERRRRVVSLALNRWKQLQSADGGTSLSISWSFCGTARGDTDLPLPNHCPESKSNSWQASRWPKWPNTSQYVPNSMFVTRLLPLQRKSNGICSVLSGLIFYVLASTLFGLQSDDGISIQNNEGACWRATKHARAREKHNTTHGSS